MRRPTYLKLVLKNAIVEDRPAGMFYPKGQADLLTLLRTLDAATRSRSVQDLILIIKDVAIGWAQIEEIHAELERFHQAGKRTIAFVEHADNRTYYLACGAQRVYLPPSGSLDLVGLRAEIFFFRNLLEYLGVQPELFSFGEYKSAGEMFYRDQMSDASRRMTASLLTDLQQRLTAKVATCRKTTSEQVQVWIDNGPYSARQAAQQGMVDGLLYEDELEKLVQKDSPQVVECSVGSLLPHEGFLRRLMTFYRPQIALIVAEGLITTGESRARGRARPLIGAETVVGLLRAARKSRRVRAVLLRVNSPGGSGLASDLIWREVKVTNEAKPVIISFGNVAASGGYYLAVGGRRIVSMPAALTGSIGVIGGKFSLKKMLDQIGVTVDHVETGTHAGYSSVARPFSETEQEIMKEQTRDFYEGLFLKKVAEGRKRSVDEIRQIAEGRVWTGAQALDNGLVDEAGGLRRALEVARQEAGLSVDQKIRLRRFARRRRLLDLLPIPLFPASDLRLFDGPLALMTEDLEIR
jgi:protease-4